MDGQPPPNGNAQQTPVIARDQFGKLLPGSKLATGHGRPYSDKGLMAQLRKRETPKNAAKVADAVWRRAMQGEAWAVEWLSNRLYGRVPQVTRLAGMQDDDGTERPIPILLLPPTPVDVIDVEASPADPPTL